MIGNGDFFGFGLSANAGKLFLARVLTSGFGNDFFICKRVRHGCRIIAEFALFRVCVVGDFRILHVVSREVCRKTDIFRTYGKLIHRFA